MPFNPFTSVTGRHALTLFDIRLENDFIVFRGGEHEAGGQLLKGVLAICVPAPIKVEDIHLRLTGVQRFCWSDPKVTPSGLTTSKVDRTTTVLHHQWPPFWGTPGRSAVLEKGNYEFPFELMLPGDTCESVEGLHEASVVYKLKATIARGKLAYDLHAYKHLRIVRTLESSALEILHAMSVENIWPNKVEYSIVVPQKAVVFGSHVNLQSRFSPLLKGLEIGDININLLEIHELVSAPPANTSAFNQGRGEFKNERSVSRWTVHVSRDEHWQDQIGETGQEGWVVNAALDLPRKLGACVQDVTVSGIKIRHKLKIVVSLKNPDGHVSELRATLPLTIYISPNTPLDDQGNLAALTGSAAAAAGDAVAVAPPGYGEHVLDQLYDEVDFYNLQTPAPRSTVHSPFYGLSRAGSSENLASMGAASVPVPPAALTSRLQAVSSREAAAVAAAAQASAAAVSTSVSSSLPRNRSASILGPGSSLLDGSPAPFTPVPRSYSHTSFLNMHRSSVVSSNHNHSTDAPHHAGAHSGSHPSSEVASRRNSGESHDAGDMEHIDYPDLSELCKVPSYRTAMRNPRVGPITVGGGDEYQLPDYITAASRSASATSLSNMVGGGGGGGSGVATPSANEPLSLIAEAPQEAAAAAAAPAEEARDDAASVRSTSSAASGGGGGSGGSRGGSRRVSRRGSRSGRSDDGEDDVHRAQRSGSGVLPNLAAAARRRTLTSNMPFLHGRHVAPSGDADERRWLHLLQARGRVST